MPDVILGIDLGTTNSLVAISENGKPRVLAAPDGSNLVASCVYWPDQSQKPLVGSSAKHFRVTDSLHTAYSVKRFIGRGKNDLDKDAQKYATFDTSASTNENVVITLGERHFSAIELSSEILKSLKELAEKTLGQKVSKAVVTVPAYFNDSQRAATKLAGQIAGLDVVRIVNEPTAAALAYGLDQKVNGIVAVYDLGGGTFDLSILRLQNGVFEVLATHGDTELGGDDFDNALFDLMLQKLETKGLNTVEALKDLEFKASLLETSEQIKKSLSEELLVDAAIVFGDHSFTVNVTRGEFEGVIQSYIDRTINIATEALKDSGLEKSQIEDVVMVGGSTRIPRVREQVSEFFGREVNISVNPDEVVALGAAVQAGILSGQNDDMVLLDVVPLSLGIETYGGTIGKLIHRNSKIPAMAQETFTTHVEGQKNVLIHVLQGERELAKDCRSLARFDLRGLPPMPAGLPKIQVTFLVDANGILKVYAKELTTNTAAAVEVKPSYGLTDEQVEKMLSDSFEFAEEDVKSRQLIDTRVEAEGILIAADKIIARANGDASPQDVQAIKLQMDAVRKQMNGVDYIAIKNELEKLEEAAKPLTESLMNQAVSKVTKNTRVDEWQRK